MTWRQVYFSYITKMMKSINKNSSDFFRFLPIVVIIRFKSFIPSVVAILSPPFKSYQISDRS